MPAPEQDRDATFPRLYTPPDDRQVDYCEFLELPTACAVYEPPATPNDRLIGADMASTPSYLVVLTGVAQDCPVGVFGAEDDAVQFAREVHANPDAHAARYFDAIERDGSVRRFFWLEVSVIEFSGPTPVKRTRVLNLH